MKTQPIDTNRKTHEPQVLNYICLLALLLTCGGDGVEVNGLVEHGGKASAQRDLSALVESK